MTLEFLGKQRERVIAEQSSVRHDLRVLTTIVLRLEGRPTGFSTNCTRWCRSTSASTRAWAGSKKSRLRNGLSYRRS
jgi:hypothetical protein